MRKQKAEINTIELERSRFGFTKESWPQIATAGFMNSPYNRLTLAFVRVTIKFPNVHVIKQIWDQPWDLGGANLDPTLVQVDEAANDPIWPGDNDE